MEELNKNFIYTCNIDEIFEVLSYCPMDDLEGLNLIILRQPKEKEEILNPCWGRLIYDFEFKAPFVKKELQNLKNEGNEIICNRREIIIKSTFQSARNTQLYRTLLHEVGHYVYNKSLNNAYDYQKKETFANQYAERIKKLIFHSL